MVEKFVGCSGYYYDHWKEIFYPLDLPKNRWLPFYAQHFNTVEINSSFYHLPQDSSVINWYNITPGNFIFTLKGYRYITHLKKLLGDASVIEMVDVFQKKAYLLKDKLGCILWQLPGSQKADMKKLESFCKLLDTSIPQVFEFRHLSWFTPEVYALVKNYKCSVCTLSAPDNLPETISTVSSVAYIRFHGKNGWYDDNYSNDQLNAWVEKLKHVSVNSIYAYFNNDFHGFAVNNGIYFSKKLEEL